MLSFPWENSQHWIIDEPTKQRLDADSLIAGKDDNRAVELDSLTSRHGKASG